MFLVVSPEKLDSPGEFHQTIEQCLSQYWKEKQLFVAPKVLMIHLNRLDSKYNKTFTKVRSAKTLNLTQHSDGQQKRYNLCG